MERHIPQHSLPLFFLPNGNVDLPEEMNENKSNLSSLTIGNVKIYKLAY